MAGETGIARRRAAARKEAAPAYTQKCQEVLRAAALLFKEKGYAGTSLGDIADAVGMDRASLYYYFDSKHQILQDAVGDVTASNLAMVRRLRASDLSDAEKIRQLFRNAIRSFDQSYPQVFVYLQEDMGRLGQRRDPWARTMRRQTKAIETDMLGLIRDGVESGSFHPDLEPELVVQALWGMINWTHRWYRPGHHSPDEVADTFSTVFLSGVVEPAARQG